MLGTVESLKASKSHCRTTECSKHTPRSFLSSEWLTCWRWPPCADCSFTQAGSKLGHAGRQEVAEDQSWHGSSTGRLQLGHHTAQRGGREAARRRWESLGCSPPSAATHWWHMKWEHGRMRRASHSRSQARQRDDCSQHSLPFSFSSFLFESSVPASRICRCSGGWKILTDIITISTTLLLYVQWFEQKQGRNYKKKILASPWTARKKNHCAYPATKNRNNSRRSLSRSRYPR